MCVCLYFNHIYRSVLLLILPFIGMVCQPVPPFVATLTAAPARFNQGGAL